MQLRGNEYKSREAERVPGASALKLGERDAKPVRGRTEPVRAHAKVARSCAVLKRANVGDAEALEVDAVPPEADARRARVTLGQKGLTQPLEADAGVFVGQIGARSCQSVYLGF